MEWANITRASLRLLPINHGKLTESKLPTLDCLIADLLDHDKELKRTEKVNLTPGKRNTFDQSSNTGASGKHDWRSARALTAWVASSRRAKQPLPAKSLALARRQCNQTLSLFPHSSGSEAIKIRLLR